jgi:hypothetical protein
MRQVFTVLAAVLLCAMLAQAQEHPANARLFATPYFTLAPTEDAGLTPAPLPMSSFSATRTPAFSAPAFSPLASSAAPVAPSSAAADPQFVQSVYETFHWQVYFGYTFFRFYIVPGTQESTNGFNYSVVYYFNNWFGVDGEMAATKGSQNGFDGWFLFGGGGPRFRWSGPRGLELWGHFLAGYSHYTPQTPFGTQSAFAYEVGGGGDITVRRTRWALRLGADMVGSHYFSTWQYSPKAFAGVVYKF